MNLFTEQELQTLSAEIDLQLRELKNEPSETGDTKRIGTTNKAIPSKQKQQLELATQEDAYAFMKKFVRAGKRDLCEEGGTVHDAMEESANMGKKAMLVIFGGILSGIGLPAAALHTTVVAVSVIVFHIGIKAFCEDCE
jgi:hypothetical protein